MGTFNSPVRLNSQNTSKDTSSKPFDALEHFKNLQAGAGSYQKRIMKDGIRFGNTLYFAKLNALPVVEFDQDSNMKFSADAYISWASGRKITADGSSLTLDGNCLVLGGVRATGYTTRVGETDYSGVASISEGSVNTFSIEIKGGIVTNFQKNS